MNSQEDFCTMKHTDAAGCRGTGSRDGRRYPGDSRRYEGFTLLELVVVLGAVLLLVATLAPGFSKSGITANAMQCLNNNRRLCMAWRMYADDSADRVTYASSIYSAPSTANWPDRYAWNGAHMDLSPSNRGNWDPTFDMMLRPLWPYVRTQSVYKCPSDRSTVTTASGVKARLMTMSMNLYVGGFAPNPSAGDPVPDGTDGGWPFAHPYRIYHKMVDFGAVGGGHDQIFVFVDERDDVANWGNYLADMTGYSPVNPAAWTFQADMPGMYHERAASFSFADGHGEIKRWTDPRTTPPYGSIISSSTPSPNNPDVYWIQDHSTRPK